MFTGYRKQLCRRLANFRLLLPVKNLLICTALNIQGDGSQRNHLHLGGTPPYIATYSEGKTEIVKRNQLWVVCSGNAMYNLLLGYSLVSPLPL